MTFLLRSYNLSGNDDGKDILPFLNRYLEIAQCATDDQCVRSDLEAICWFIVGTNERSKTADKPGRWCARPCFRGEVIGKVVEALVVLRKWDSLRRAINCVAGALPLSTFEIFAPLVERVEFDILRSA